MSRCRVGRATKKPFKLSICCTSMNRAILFALLLLPLLVFLLLETGPVDSSDVKADQQATPSDKGAADTDRKQEAQPVFRTISAGEAAELIRNRKDLQVIDVRTPQERKQFRIADSRLVPVGDVIRGVFKADPNKPLMLVCAVGGRSYVAGKVMFGRGYREIYNLDGGIESWRRAGLPLETDPETLPK